MSTTAMIKIDDMFFSQDYDGYPNDVIPELQIFVEKAKQKVSKRNPDYTFWDCLKKIMMDENYDFSNFENSFENSQAQYYYQIDKDGKVYVLNPMGDFVLYRSEGEKIIITSPKGFERMFYDWNDYVETFTCYCVKTGVKKVERMVDVDGTNLEEHLVCPLCGKDDGVL
jgi:hypothetical protein